ncbi:thioredoxin-like domain-containing protein [Luteolibacter sp. SL250]|uniref:thioredoxin-like domain-containing protein n=1 Tax=Luteolibacter sp. SL250 TaxID=2995170 RepID=UPI002271CBEB|nr:thioredoxin-like domain-containing protein [Luteolibacter sp. SL250]WAC21635.1 thioredoxin-like domain-containing protein [Luteolibacter sp. SL250]
MKTSFLIPVVSGLLAASAFAGFETWTSKDGKPAELELVSVSDSGGEKTGAFRVKNGRTISIKASALSEADARRLADWKPAEPASGDVAATAGKPSKFDEILDGNLVKLDGRSFKRFSQESKPGKYYIFYYTASWCGPCHKYSPVLVDFYNKNKNANFEIVLITSDSDEGAMEDYAKEKKMPWPQLKMSRVERFEKQFDHKITGIPSVITCDLEGNIVSRSESVAELAKLVK